MVIMYFIVSVVNNAALGFNISMPLHMIFRAVSIKSSLNASFWHHHNHTLQGSLMANMMLGMIILNKRYTKVKYLSVIIISLGIAACTIVSGRSVSSKVTGNEAVGGDETDVESSYDFMWWMLGIAMLTFALFMSARMGIYQEVIYAKYGKHSNEALFYCVRRYKSFNEIFFTSSLSYSIVFPFLSSSSSGTTFMTTLLQPLILSLCSA